MKMSQKLTQEKSIIAVGVLVVLLPFTGFPPSWKRYITIALGIILIYLGSLVWRKNKNSVQKMEVKTETYTESL